MLPSSSNVTINCSKTDPMPLSGNDSPLAENKESSKPEQEQTLHSNSSSENDDSDDDVHTNQATSAVKTVVTGKDYNRLLQNVGRGQLPARNN